MALKFVKLQQFSVLFGVERVLQEVQQQLLKVFAPIIQNLLTVQESPFCAGTFVDVTFSASATDTIVQHNLGTANVGFLTGNQSVAGSIYEGDTDNTANAIYLRASAPMTAVVYVYPN